MSDNDGMWTAKAFDATGAPTDPIIGDTYDEIRHFIERAPDAVTMFEVFDPEGRRVEVSSWCHNRAEMLDNDEDLEDGELSRDERDAYLDSSIASNLLEMGVESLMSLGTAPDTLVVFAIAHSDDEAPNIAISLRVPEDTDENTPDENVLLGIVAGVLVHLGSRDQHENRRVKRALVTTLEALHKMTFEDLGGDA